MKKMMTNMKTLVALLMAGAAVTSCSSDNEMDSPKAPAAKTYTMTVQATKGGDAMTRALADGGTTLTATWSVGDVVKVYNSSSVELGTLTAQAAGASTTLTGTLTTAPTDQETLTLKYLSPSYATQDGTLTGTDNSIDKKCDYATATVTATVDGDNVTTTAAAFEHQQAIVRFTLKNSDGTALPSNPTAFTMTDGTSTVELTSIPAGTYTTNGAGVLYVAFPASNGSADITLTATVGTDTYTCTASNKTFYTENFYRVTAKMTKQAAVPEGAISGKFSVSATKQVYFSKGNLRYASGTWSFFDNQYDYYTSYSAGAWDKFGWSTSTTNYGMNTSTSNSTYSGNFVDWGATMGSGWRTLTGGEDGGEWEYLFGTNSYYKRTTTSGLYFAKATVNGKSGVILLPDDWSTSYYTLNSTNSIGAAFNTNTISESDWSSKLESHGCVFLPAAGNRDYGTTVKDDGYYGGYWSRTAHGSDSEFAHDVYFDSENVHPAYSWDRYRGLSVRLVRDAN